MLDCREQKIIEKLSEELEKAGYTHISFQVVHTKSRTTSVRGPKSVKKQDSEDAVYVIEAAYDGKKGKSYWTSLPEAEPLIVMMEENIEALGEKCDEDVDNSADPDGRCGENPEENIKAQTGVQLEECKEEKEAQSDEQTGMQFVWEDHETVLKKLAEAKEGAYQVPNTDLVDYLGYEQYLEEIYVLGPGHKKFMDATGYHSLRADLKAEKDGQASYARGCCYVSGLEDDSAKKLACEIAKEARAGLGAEPIASGQYPVILKNSVMAELLEAYIPAFYADRIKNERSVLAGREGEKIASANVSLKEVPDLKEGRVCRRIDDEGIPVKEKYLIKDGTFKTKLVNKELAKELKIEPTGNGFKQSLKSDVGIGITNVILQSESDLGEKSESSILDLKKKMCHGILVTDVDGVFAGINVMTGTFSLIVKGRKIEDGRETDAFCQVTIAGNFFDMLSQIQGMANDYTSTYPDCASVIAPSVYVGELAVSGI